MTLRSDAAYLVVGGAGGLGLAVADWLASRGARHLILVGRSALPARDRWDAVPANDTRARIDAIRAIEARGVEVRYAQVDVTSERELSGFLAEHREAHPREPLRGVVHAAGVWRDRSIAQMGDADLDAVLEPKIKGAWLLDRHLAGESLDFFALFSSFSSILPPARQANYAAANAFLDALAQRRRQEGRAGISINWGPWSEVGFAATEAGIVAHRELEQAGIGRLTPREAVGMLDRLLQSSDPQLGVISLDFQRLSMSDPSLSTMPMLSRLFAADVSAAGDGRPAPGISERAGDPVEFERSLIATVAHVLESGVTALPLRTPLTELGLDSLMALQVKNRVTTETGVNVPLVALLDGGSIASLIDRFAAASSLQRLDPAWLAQPSEEGMRQ